jgi:hypothetical protein
LLGTQIHNLTRTAAIVFGALAVIAIVAGIVVLRRNEARLIKEAEEAIPELA